MTTQRTNLLNFNRKALADFFVKRGDKPYRAQQIFKWVYQQGAQQFDEMTDLSKALRESLAVDCEIKGVEVVREALSKDGTYKWLLRLEDGNCIETVFIPHKDRGTLCVSSQVGCALNCQFCSTGKQGFSRDLTIAEIIGQVYMANHRLRLQQPDAKRIITNVVMMGMGEPLLNYDNVVAAMDIMLDDFAYGISKRRVTLSTSGVIPAMKKLMLDSSVSLAVSLHAPDDKLRDELVPINKKYPLKELMAVCRDYCKEDSRRTVTFEYVMLKEVNDSVAQAKALIRLLEGVPCKVNLIPFNTFPNTHYECSSDETIEKFQQKLMRAGIITTVRRSRGDDVDAACGQLVGNVLKKKRVNRTGSSSALVIPIEQESVMQNRSNVSGGDNDEH